MSFWLMLADRDGKIGQYGPYSETTCKAFGESAQKAGVAMWYECGPASDVVLTTNSNLSVNTDPEQSGPLPPVKSGNFGRGYGRQLAK